LEQSGLHDFFGFWMGESISRMEEAGVSKKKSLSVGGKISEKTALRAIFLSLREI
jgi:hypothetical protein